MLQIILIIVVFLFFLLIIPFSIEFDYENSLELKINFLNITLYKKEENKKKVEKYIQVQEKKLEKFKEYITFGNTQKLYLLIKNVLKKCTFKKLEIDIKSSSIFKVISFFTVIPCTLSALDLKIQEFHFSCVQDYKEKSNIHGIITISLAHIIYEFLRFIIRMKKRGNKNVRTSNRKSNGIVHVFP